MTFAERLRAVGRNEEATGLAQQLADSGQDVNSLIGLLANGGKEKELIEFLEDRWADLNAFEGDYPILRNNGVNTMLDIAYAYSIVGNQDRFTDAMHRSRTALDATAELGVQSWFSDFAEATYWVLAGELETSLAKLEKAVTGGFTLGGRFSGAWAALPSLKATDR